MRTEITVEADTQPTPLSHLADMPLTDDQADETRAGGLSKVGPGTLVLPNGNY